MKYFIYCRKSTEDESKQVQSLETQKTLLLNYAIEKKYHVVDIFTESKSAKIDNNRPLFTQMLERIGAGEAGGILVAHIDRLSRNGIESGTLIKLFESGSLEEIRTPARSYTSVSDLLYLDFDFVFASYYSRNLSIRVKEGNATKLRKGEYPGKAPIGYLNKDGRIYPDPTRGRFITETFFLYSTGKYNLRQLVDYLYAQGFRTTVSRKKVNKSVIHTILQNPLYYGAIKYNGFLYKGNHKQLTTKATFDKVQDIFQGKNRSHKETHDFLYRDFLYCGFCDCKLTASIKKGQYIYYYCTNGKRICIEHKTYMNEDYIFKKLKHLIKNFTLNKDKADMAFDMYIQNFKRDLVNKVDTKTLIQKEIDQLDKKLDKLLDLHLEGNIEKEKYTEKQKELQNEKTQLEISLTQVKEVNPERTLELLEEFKNEACSLDEMFENGDDEVRRDLLNSLLWNCKIQDREILSVQYKRPYEYVKDFNKTDDFEVLLAYLDWN